MCIYSGLCCHECGVNEMGCYKRNRYQSMFMFTSSIDHEMLFLH